MVKKKRLVPSPARHDGGAGEQSQEGQQQQQHGEDEHQHEQSTIPDEADHSDQDQQHGPLMHEFSIAAGGRRQQLRKQSLVINVSNPILDRAACTTEDLEGQQQHPSIPRNSGRRRAPSLVIDPSWPAHQRQEDSSIEPLPSSSVITINVVPPSSARRPSSSSTTIDEQPPPPIIHDPPLLGGTKAQEARQRKSSAVSSSLHARTLPPEVQAVQRRLQRVNNMNINGQTNNVAAGAPPSVLSKNGNYGRSFSGFTALSSTKLIHIGSMSSSALLQQTMSNPGSPAAAGVDRDDDFEEAMNAAAYRKDNDDGLDDDDDEGDRSQDMKNFEGAHLLYGLERCIWYFQSLAAILLLKVQWPPNASIYGQQLKHTLDYTVYWLDVLSGYMEVEAVLFYWDLVSYGIVVIIPPFLICMMFYFWTIPDYTDSKHTRNWVRKYITQWWWPNGTFIRSTISFLIGLVLTGCTVYLLKLYVGGGMDIIVGSAAGGFIVGIWVIYLVCIAFIRRHVLTSTQGVAIAAVDHILKGIVSTKIRFVLFLVLICFVPTVLALLKAVTPLLDWNDTNASPWRRPYNFEIPCYYMAFPPSFNSLTNTTTPVVICDSVYGVALYTFSSTALFFFVGGLGLLLYYLGETTFEAFKKTDWYDNFEFFNNIHQTHLDKLKPHPKHRVVIEQARYEGREIVQKMREVLLNVLTKTSPAEDNQALKRRKERRNATHALNRVVRSRWLSKKLTRIKSRMSHLATAPSNKSFVWLKRLGFRPKWLAKVHPTSDTEVQAEDQSRAKDKAKPRRRSVQWPKALLICWKRSGQHTLSPKSHPMASRKRLTAARSKTFRARLKEHLEARTKGKSFEYRTQNARWRQSLTLRHQVREHQQATKRRNDEYIIAIKFFEDDHDLILSTWDSILDASGYLFLIENYVVDCRHWRLMQLAEMFFYCLFIVALQRRDSPSAQLSGAMSVTLLSTLCVWWYRPFLRWRHKWLEYLIKAQTFFNLFIGLLCESGSITQTDADNLLFVSNASTILLMAYLLKVIETLFRWIFLNTTRSMDAYVVNFIFSLMDGRWSVVEQPNQSLILLQQWDELLHEQQCQLLIGAGTARPRTILTCWERNVYMKWAAMRNLKLVKLHSWTGMNVLHAAMTKDDSNLIRWLISAYPMLLKEVDESGETPYITLLKECAKKLIHYEEKRTQRAHYEMAKYFEVLMSPELQSQCLNWDKRRFRFLRDRANPTMGALTQLLAVSCNLKPPKGFSRMEEWSQFGDTTIKFLAETFVFTRQVLDLSDSGLGHVAHTALTAVLEALVLPHASIPLKSLFYAPNENRVQSLNLSGNRLDASVGEHLADILLRNTILTYLDLSDNLLDDRAGVFIARALSYNNKIETLLLQTNMLGPDSGNEIAKMLRRNKAIATLDLSNNRLGPKTFWRGKVKYEIEGAGLALGGALAYNHSLTSLKLSHNTLGEAIGTAIAETLARNKSLTDLDLQHNDLRPDAGRLLANALEYRNGLTRLNIRQNSLGPDAGLIFASSLRKNKGLTSLDVSGNNLGSSAGKILAMAMRDNTGLTHLDMSENGCGPEVFRAMGRALQQNSSLTDLNLARSHFGLTSFEGGSAEHVADDFDKCLAVNDVLIKLDLSHCGIPPIDVVTLMAGLKNNYALMHLNLQGHSIEEVAIVQLGTRMRYHHMHTVNLHDCAIALKPAEVLTQAITASKHLQELDLGGSKLGTEAALRLAKFLARKSSVVKVLNLEGSHIGEMGGVGMAQMMVWNKSLEELNLSRNELAHDFAREFGKSIRTVFQEGVVIRFCLLKVLDLSYNPLGDKGVRRILHALRNNDVTESINVAGTTMGVAGAKEVAELIRRAVVKWRYLNAADNDMGRENLNEILWALRSNTSLRTLILASNKAGDKFGTYADEVEENGVALVEAVASNRTLKALDLSDNQLSPECGSLFIESLHENPSLTSIVLEKNALDAQAFEEIAEFLTKDSRIREVRLRGNNGGWRACLAFADVIGTNSCILHLDLADNMLGENGPEMTTKIAHAVSFNATLNYLDLGKNRLGPECGRLISQALCDNKSLTYVDLQANRFDATVGEDMRKMLSMNKTLLTLSMTDVEIGSDAYRAIMNELQERN